jgi:hypothetical protein
VRHITLPEQVICLLTSRLLSNFKSIPFLLSFTKHFPKSVAVKTIKFGYPSMVDRINLTVARHYK